MEQIKENENESKKKDESKKEEEIKDIVTIDEKDKMNEEDIIKLDENLLKYIKNKIFILNDKWKLNLENLYYKIRKRKPISNLDVTYFDSFTVIPLFDTIYIFFYKLIPVEIKAIYKDKQEKENFSICSTYELSIYCKKKNYNPYIEIGNDKYELKQLFEDIYLLTFMNLDNIILVQDYRNYDDYRKDNLQNSYPNDNSELEPKKLSKFFNLFFLFETKDNFYYWDNIKRRYFIMFIISLKSRNDIYCFKICGPSGIGKSMTLFLISRYYNNFLYYNLKAIKKLKQSNDNVEIQNIITESCKYLLLDEKQVEELSSIIKKNRIFSFFICLQNIAEFLIKNNIKSFIILDKFKNNSIDKNEYEQLLLLIKNQTKKAVKLLICSSTNDKEIREECIKSWKKKIFSFKQLNNENQINFFYVDELCNDNLKDNTIYNKALIDFNYIPKYKNKFEYLKNETNVTQKLNEDLKEIKERVKNNLKELYSIIYEKDKSEEIIMMKELESLRYLDLHIDEETEYEKLEEFSNICSFKYYRFKFEQNFFKINYNFPYMKEIIDEIINTHLEDFYKYKRKYEHTGSANADFFELFSGYSIKKRKLELPESENTITVKVNEIVEMNSFLTSHLDNFIQKGIYSNLQEYKFKKEDFFQENKEIKEEFNKRKLFLELNNIINYNCKDIEYYKLQYLSSLNKEYCIFGDKNLGNMSVFINQSNQRGKKLDLAYVYGKKEEKVFIGFQMKAYNEDDSSHDCKFDATKDDLKKALQPMIVNIKYLMDMDIKSWHYIVIILIDAQKEEGKQYFKSIVKKCKQNGFEYIFHEPTKQKFFDRNFKEITKFIPNQFSNLDNNIETILPMNIIDDDDIDEYMKNFSSYMINNNISDVNYIEEGLSSLINMKRKRNNNSNLKAKNKKDKKDEIKIALSDILNNIIIKFNFKYAKFVGAYDFSKNSFNIPNPKLNYFLLISSSNKDIFFIVFNKKNKIDKYYEYNINSTIDISTKNSDVITSIKSDNMYAKINKKEKFYVFIFEEEKK